MILQVLRLLRRGGGGDLPRCGGGQRRSQSCDGRTDQKLSEEHVGSTQTERAIQFLMIRVVMGMVLVDSEPRWERKVDRADSDEEADLVGVNSRDPRQTISSCMETEDNRAEIWQLVQLLIVSSS